ncbi:MAG: hypothetical protein ACXWEE_01820 [Thermoleophilaceae bacterium]
MKSILSRRPSPALVISCIALFVSLGGVSYGVATGFIDSREIKNNQVRSSDLRNNTIRTFDIRNNEVRGFDIRNSSVQGRDVALNTLTGADVSEQDLGKVPSAAAADSAASVGGVTPKAFAYVGEAGSGFVPVLSLGGLTLEARCVAASDLEVRANPAVQNSEVVSDLPPAQVSSADFDPGENFLVAPVASAADGAGSIVFAGADGRVVTIEALVREDANGVRGTTNDCGFFGVAQAG